ncbi:MAG: type II secretion system protein [Alphaproteobacteria bacterium]|nr:type II secretion system protein [Alphaproteobacteria bacterium]
MRRTSSEHGFTLLEVLVALTILSVGLAVLFGIFGNSLSRSRETQSRLEARALATSLLADSESAPALAYGERNGRTGSGLAWRVRVQRYGNDKDLQAWPAAAARVTATVSWGDGGNGQTLSLSTLRLLPKDSAP